MVEIVHNNDGINLINEEDFYSLLANILIDIDEAEE